MLIGVGNGICINAAFAGDLVMVDPSAPCPGVKAACIFSHIPWEKPSDISREAANSGLISHDAKMTIAVWKRGKQFVGTAIY